MQLCSQVTDKGLANLMPLSNLEMLDVSGCVAVTQKGFVHVSNNHKGLRGLKLGGCSRMATVTDACLSPVSNLTALTSLDMAGCIEVTDSGIASWQGTASSESSSFPFYQSLSQVGTVKRQNPHSLSESPRRRAEPCPM